MSSTSAADPEPTVHLRRSLDASDASDPSGPSDPRADAPTGLVPAAACAPGFVDVESDRDAWDALRRRAQSSPLNGFAACRARSRGELPEHGPAASRVVTTVRDGRLLRGAAAFTIERVRHPFTWLRLASLTGALGDFMPGGALIDPEDAADTWRSILAGLIAEAGPDGIEIGPLPVGTPTWTGLLEAATDRTVPVQVVRSRVAGAWGPLTLPEVGEPAPWDHRIAAERAHLERAGVTPTFEVVESTTDVSAALHETDRALRRLASPPPAGGAGDDATGLDGLPGGAAMVRNLVRSAADEGRSIAVAMRHPDGRCLGRAVAILDGDDAACLAVTRATGRTWRRHALGHLAFAALAEELGRRGVRRVETGAAGIWFHNRASRSQLRPMRTVLLAAGRGDRARIFTGMADLVGRVPRLGPFERFVGRLRPWADQTESDRLAA